MENGYKKIDLNPKLITSSKISLLLGSGANGNLFPKLYEFKKTIEKLKDILGKKEINAHKIEYLISGIKDIDKREEVLKTFKNEIHEFHNDINFDNSSTENIFAMLQELDRLVQYEENRTFRTKQINIFTLNYDTILETILKESGLFCNVLMPNNVKKQSYLYSLIGQDYMTKKYKTTFLLSKIHGNIDDPILPGLAKFDELLAEKYFELLFNMKSILKEPNSTLFVIGYSGNDEHINQLMDDCVGSGLTIYWLRYKKEEKIPSNLEKKVIVIDQPNDTLEDTTKLLAEGLRKLW
jgi:hypothetical protein